MGLIGIWIVQYPSLATHQKKGKGSNTELGTGKVIKKKRISTLEEGKRDA